MGKTPADQFYWNDWLSDVELQSASTVSRGVWINALCRMWYAKVRGELTGTVKTLSKLCNCTEAEFQIFLDDAQALGFCYVLQNPNGVFVVRNRRMYNNEKEKQNNRLRQQEWYKRHKVKRQSNKNLTTPSSSSSSSSNNKILERFELFWKAYPKKKSKGQAEKAWLKIKPSEQLLEKIISTIERAKTSVEWTKDGGQFIPYPATWLNAKGWEDDYGKSGNDRGHANPFLSDMGKKSNR